MSPTADAPINAAAGSHDRLIVSELLRSEKNIIKSTTATAAPPVIPIISGDARGFLTSPCNIAPAAAKQTPAHKAVKILGMRNDMIISSSSLEPAPKNVFATSQGGINLCPRPALMMSTAAVNPSKTKKTIHAFFSAAVTPKRSFIASPPFLRCTQTQAFR